MPGYWERKEIRYRLYSDAERKAHAEMQARRKSFKSWISHSDDKKDGDVCHERVKVLS